MLLIDNYDSFTYNLVQYLGDLGVSVETIRNDVLSAAEVIARRPEAIMLSPGPCTPNEAGICLDLVAAAAQAHIPLIGICLGHQAIGQHFGGKVTRAREIMHGKMGEIHHNSKSVFNGLPNPFKATRYHSLIVERESVPDCLEITAWTPDGTIMGLRHRELPIHGVQFHPESIASENGHELLRNFLDLVEVPA